MRDNLRRWITAQITWKRALRLVGCASLVFTVAVLPMIAALVGSGVETTHVAAATTQFPVWVIVLFVVGLIGLGVYTYEEYQRRTHDPTWVFKYQDQFDSSDFVELRRFAVEALQQPYDRLNTRLAEVDPVLDFFEDLGFYVSGGQISAEVVHHHFFYWIRGYFQAAKAYIEERRKDEPAQWNHLESLALLLNEIEFQESGKRFNATLSKDEIFQFFADEMATSDALRAKGSTQSLTHLTPMANKV